MLRPISSPLKTKWMRAHNDDTQQEPFWMLDCQDQFAMNTPKPVVIRAQDPS